MTTALQVKTIELTPAVVKFNFDELASAIDMQLKKYEGLTFTDETVADCKKTITELNKAKKSLDTYRKDTKTALSVSITEFEAQCKELGKKFDEAITPLKLQHETFEDNRKFEKRKQIEPIIKELIEAEGLNEKYAAQLIIPDEYFNKSKTLTAIKKELGEKATFLGGQQDVEEANSAVIKSHVELMNAKYNKQLPDAPYLNLIGVKSLDEIKNIIATDATVQTTQSFATPATKNLVVEKYSIEGTDDQLDELEAYMTSHGIKWSVIES